MLDRIVVHDIRRWKAICALSSLTQNTECERQSTCFVCTVQSSDMDSG